MINLPDVKVGLKVECPARRGKKAYRAEIVWIGGHADQAGTYRWVTVRDAKGREESWPSNRLNVEAS